MDNKWENVRGNAGACSKFLLAKREMQREHCRENKKFQKSYYDFWEADKCKLFCGIQNTGNKYKGIFGQVIPNTMQVRYISQNRLQ